MATIKRLSKSIQTAKQLYAIVKTMKALAATGIRQYEQAVDASSQFRQTVEMGLQVLMRQLPILPTRASQPMEQHGVIVLGSDQGMCGALNERIVDMAVEQFQKITSTRKLVVIGYRAAARFTELNYSPDLVLRSPNALDSITPMLQKILVQIEQWHTCEGAHRIDLCYHQYISGSVWQPLLTNILPLDPQSLQDLASKKWPTKIIPTFTMAQHELLASLTRQYLFVTLFQAFTAALASENAARLIAMQSAEKGINERLESLQFQYHRERQAAITSEILDVISGAEGLTE